MTDNEFRNYIDKRCTEEPFEVPPFDGFFTDEELSVNATPNRVFPLWSRIAAATAVAAAVTLLVILKPDASTNPEPVNLENWIISEVQSSEEAGSSPIVLVASERSIRSDISSHPYATSDITGQISTPEEDFVIPSPAMDTTAENTSLPDAEKKEILDTQPSENIHSDDLWEQNIQSAAAGRKQRKQVAAMSVAFNCNNSLLSYNASSQSTVSMITRHYQSGSMLRSSAVNKNEWKIPENLDLTRSEIAAYTPVYNLPLTGAIGVSFPLGKYWDLRTGVTYTYLSANTYGKMDNSQSFSLYQHLHYIGIPLQFAFNILDNAFGLYVSAGGGLEKGLAGVQYSHVYDKDGQQISCIKLTQSVAGLQPYVSFQVGASYRISQHIKIYIEPSLSYYFDTDQPISVRTKRPLYIGLGAGLRFATGK